MNRWWYLLVFGLVIVGLFVSASLEWMRSIGRTSLLPTSAVQDGVRQTRGFFETLRDVGQLGRTNAELTEQKTKLEAEVAVLREHIGRDERLKQEVSQTTGFHSEALVPARVIARSPVRALDELTLNIGSDDGVATGQPVLKSGYLVGLVRDVDPNRCVVTLLTSAQTTIPVLLQESRGQGILRGGLEGLVVSDLPIDIEIKPGEVVLTSALGDLVPSDIPVGRASTIVSRESEILQRVMLSSPIKFSIVEEVLVVTDPKVES